MACNGIAEFFPCHGVICGAAAGPPQHKVGVVCFPDIFYLVNNYRSFKELATMVYYEKLNSSCMGLR